MIKILVIDDDRMNCELIQSVFTRHGYQVVTATSGIEGLTLFRQQAPHDRLKKQTGCRCATRASWCRC